MVSTGMELSGNMTSSPPQPVKRATRVYGRPKDPEIVPAPSSVTVAETTPHWRSTFITSNSTYIDDNISTKRQSSRHSRGEDLVDDDELAEDDKDASKGEKSQFQWSWQKDLEAIDQASDHDFHTGLQLQSPSSPDVHPGTPSRPSSSKNHSRSVSPDSPPVTSRKPPRRKAMAVESDSDSEGARPAHSPFTSSPSKVAAMKLSTPPTSEDERSSKPRSTGKARASTSVLRQDSYGHIDAGLLEVSPPRKTKSRKSVKSKVKAPTKKEMAETQKDRFRIAADQRVSIKKEQDINPKFTLMGLLDKLKGDTTPQNNALKQASSDPIISFSSPLVTPSRPDLFSVQVGEMSRPPQASPLPANDSDSDDLPDVNEMVAKEMEKSDSVSKQRKLRELKLRLMANKEDVQDESDDELEIVESRPKDPRALVNQAAKHRKSGRKSGLRDRRISVLPPTKAKPSLQGQKITATSITENLYRTMESKKVEMTREKEEQWVQRGGRLAETIVTDSNVLTTAEAALKAYNERATMEEEMQVDEGEASDEDEDGSEHLRGSASPEPEDDQLESPSLADTTLVDEEADEKTEEEDEGEQQFIKHRRRAAPVVHSDSENDENDENRAPPGLKRSHASIGRILVEDSSMMVEDTGINLGSSDEGDKENYDRSDDKENTAVRPLFPRSMRQGSGLFGLTEGLQRHLSMSPGPGEIDDDDEIDARPPLQTLSDDPSSSAATLLPSPSLKSYRSSAGTQSWNDEPGLVALQSGFSQLFETGTEKQTKTQVPRLPGGFRGLFKEPSKLGLTQDALLQPAFEVDENLKRKTDEIFEKEQRLLVEAANSKISKPEEDLYVNEHGFLTQTRPTADAEVYRSSLLPSQSLGSLGPSIETITPISVERRPLRTLSFSKPPLDNDEPESPSQPTPFVRLRRSPIRQKPGYRSSPSPPFAPRDAFSVLREGAKATVKQPKLGKPSADVAGFFEDEAQESDEDNFGYKVGGPDDEETGEDLDVNLATLVDDSKMDAEQEAADKVQEKFQEHIQQDDEQLEALHMDAIHGKLRNKRHRGAGFDSDDDEEEDERNIDIRRGMRRKIPRFEREDILAYAKDPQTEAFYRGYQATTEDNYAELAFLQNPTSQDVTMVEPDEDREDDDEDQKSKYITREELVKEVRQHADEDEVDPSDLNDVSWIEGDSDDELSRVKVTVKTKSMVRQTEDMDGFQMGRPLREDIKDQTRLKTWAKAESRSSKNSGTGRSGVGTAVTGHKKGGNRAAGVAPSQVSRSKPSLKPAMSMLAEFERKTRADRL
ncbi:hypothetical protein C8J56DRAFT_935419 [Mycena floridula]|nr:hypothetical protein C8J56DRAFT_935419 [Mycena floridula]